MEVVIRQEKAQDFARVYEVHTAAFAQESEAKLVEALRKKMDVFVHGLSLVAEIEGKIIGHILFTKIRIVDQKQNEWQSLALAPLAVKPAFQKQGIGGRLIKHGLAAALAAGFGSVIVLGHKDYYPKFGFLAASLWGIRPPFDVPSDVFMAMELFPDALKNISGMVQYPNEFLSA